jgi:hypothetical protein
VLKCAAGFFLSFDVRNVGLLGLLVTNRLAHNHAPIAHISLLSE